MTLLIVPNLSHMAPRGLRDVDPAFWTPRSIAARGLEVTTAGEYVPRWVTAAVAYRPRVAAVVEGDADVEQTGRTPVSWSAEVTARRPSAIQLAIAYFPGWQVRIDGLDGNAKPAAGTGQMRFDVPQGEHRVEAQWTRTGLVWLGDGVTLAALAALALAARWSGNGWGRTLRQDAPPSRGDPEPE
jgi:hypothetical protein